MLLGDFTKDPDNAAPVSVDFTDYLADGVTVSSVAWSAATGLTTASASLIGSVATAKISGGQEGCDYLVTAEATLSDGTTIDATVRVKVRTGEDDPRLTR